MEVSGSANTANEQDSGVLASLRRLGSALLATLHSRADLLGYELARERIRVTRIVLLGVAALFFVMLGAITATILVIALFWEGQRFIAIGSLTVLYFGIAAALGLFAKSQASRAARPFAASIEQLRKDREHFTRR